MIRCRIFILACCALFVSCASQKKLVYFQGEIPPLSADSVYQLKIFPGDLLSVQVFTINTEAFPYLSTPNERQGTDNRSPYEKGYLVNNQGEITMPLVGIVPLRGLTLQEASEAVRNKFKEYLDDPVVTVKRLDFKVTVLGEVNRPGTYRVDNELATLPEVLGMAGDLSQFADRKMVRIIRNDDSVRKDFFVDLTDAKSLQVSTYYIHPGDIIYVQPVKRRAFQNISPSVTLFTSILTTAIVVTTFIVTQTK